MTSALYESGKALGFNSEQVDALVFFWDLPNKTPDDIRAILNQRLQLSDHLIEQFLQTLSVCMSENPFNISAFCQQLWSNKQTLEASALLLYFQQQYFTKSSIQESSTRVTPFIEKKENAEKIKVFANTIFDMCAERSIKGQADITFLFGGKAKTCALYYSYFQQNGLKNPCIFLSTRSLSNDATDNPSPTPEFYYERNEPQTYHDYLKGNYLERYNQFLARYFINSVSITEPTEGLVMFERYEKMFNISFEDAYDKKLINVIYTSTQNAMDFYRQALRQAVENQVLQPNMTIALATLQPYFSYYEALFDVVKNEVAIQLGQDSDYLNTVNRVAYGPSNVPNPSIIAQRLAAVIDINYQNATINLKKRLGFDNAVIIPKESLRANYIAKSLLFVFSSEGDRALGEATIRRFSRAGRKCTILSLAIPSITQSLIEFTKTLEHVSMFTEQINNKPILDCHEEEIAAYIHSCGFSSIYIGLPSENNDEMAYKLALRLNMPVIFNNEWMSIPPSDHAVWRYRGALISNPNIHFTESLAASNIFPADRRSIISHLSLAKSPATSMSIEEQLGIRNVLEVNSEQPLVIVSGTTREQSVDMTFLTELLEELPNHPSIQMRYSIHPGIKNKADYIEKLLIVTQQAQIKEKQFKIILNHTIIKDLNPEKVEQFKSSPWILIADVSGPKATEASDGFAQAVQGAITNRCAKQKKPAFSRGNQPLLPSTWFADAPCHFFQAVSEYHQEKVHPAAHTLEEIGINDENSPDNALAQLML